MIAFRLRFILESKGIPRPYSFLVKNGFTHNTAIRYLNGNVDLLNLHNLEKLCKLVQCTPHDLFEWIPSASETVTDKHVLYPLIRNDKPYNIVNHINKLPLSKMNKIREYIDKIKDSEE